MRVADRQQYDPRDVLNALDANIAVLDARGVVVTVNEAWIRFARANGATDPRFYVGTDYLALCDRAVAAGIDGGLAEMTAKLRALLAGDGESLSMEYPCDSPEERRWFSMKATRLEGASGTGVVIAHEDITARKRTEHTLRETEQVLRLMLEALPVGVWIMDATGRIVHGNPAGLEIWRGAHYVGPEEFGVYKAWWVDSGRLIAADEWAAARAIRSGERSINEEIEIECFDGTHKIILNSALPLIDDGTVRGAIIVNQDITARKRGEEELEAALSRERFLARIDPLTGAINRRQFFDLALQEIAVALRYRQPLSLILIDVDDFKRTNDTHGHRAGDEVLKRIAQTANRHLRAADLFARYGGDEFIVLLPHTHASEAAVVAERIRTDLATQGTVLERGTLTATISSGIAELMPREDTLDALIHRADVALYDAKQAGRNRTAIFARGASPTPPPPLNKLP